MAKDIDEGSRYPLPVYNFRVDILNAKFPGAQSGSGDDTGINSARFSEVSGLDLSIAPVVYRDGFSFLTGPTIMAGREEELRLTMKRGIIQKDSFLYDWLVETRSMLTHGKRDLHIALCDEEGVAVVHWHVRGAMPTKLTGPSFSAESNDVAIETLELIAGSVRMEFSA